MPNKNWEQTEYKKLIRIKASDLEYIKMNKEQLSAAGFLQHIIKTYRERNKPVDK